jgi:hypothetical protein
MRPVDVLEIRDFVRSRKRDRPNAHDNEPRGEERSPRPKNLGVIGFGGDSRRRYPQPTDVKLCAV